MSDPVAGQACSIEAATYANKVTQALDYFNAMGRREVEDAINTLATVGQSAVQALAGGRAKCMERSAFNLRAVSRPKSLGLTSARSPGGTTMTTRSAYNNSPRRVRVTRPGVVREVPASLTTGGMSSLHLPARASESVSDSQAAVPTIAIPMRNAFADHSGRSPWSNFADKSSDATVTCEFFLATIERPWLLGDLLNMDGWYLVG